MATVVKYAGAAITFVALAYGTYCVISVATSEAELRSTVAAELTLTAQQQQWEQDIQSTEEKILSVSKETQQHEETVRRLEAEVAQKKADLEVSHKKMAEASDALSKSLQAISELSRVSNDLRNRIVANEPLRKKDSLSIERSLEEAQGHQRAEGLRNDLQSRIAAHELMQQEAAAKVASAQEKRQKAMAELNPLNHPKVRALLSGSQNS